MSEDCCCVQLTSSSTSLHTQNLIESVGHQSGNTLEDVAPAMAKKIIPPQPTRNSATGDHGDRGMRHVTLDDTLNQWTEWNRNGLKVLKGEDYRIFYNNKN